VPGLIDNRIKRNQDVTHASGVIRRHCLQLIVSKKQKISEGKGGSNDILEVALKSGAFTDQELVDQLMTFLAAGHETTATALTWVIYLLCKHPRTQSKVREEIKTAIPDKTCAAEQITSSTIDSLHYLQAVCNEALRLYPPVALTVRVAVKDTTVAGEHLPKGTAIMLPPWAVNATREIWGPDAAEFVPERWLNPSKSGGSSSNFSFLTFLHGPRSCIGEKFARAELACLVAAWVGAFDTRLFDEEFVVEARGGLTVKPKDGLLVRIKAVD
jgi:cytochrome P450